MPKHYVPVTNPELPKSEQNPDDPAMQQHRNFDKFHRTDVWAREAADKRSQDHRTEREPVVRRSRPLVDGEFLDPFEKRKASKSAVQTKSRSASRSRSPNPSRSRSRSRSRSQSASRNRPSPSRSRSPPKAKSTTPELTEEQQMMKAMGLPTDF